MPDSTLREILAATAAATGDELITFSRVEVATGPADRLAARILLHCLDAHAGASIGELTDALTAAAWWLGFHAAAETGRRLIEAATPPAVSSTAVIALRRTDRGFLRGEFTDLYDAPCSIQESSLATESALWLGVDGSGTRMHLDQATAAILSDLLRHFAAYGDLHGRTTTSEESPDADD